MTDTVIDWVNIFGKYQPELLLFSDLKGQLIIDGDVNLTVLDGDGNYAPLKTENENDLNYQ